MITSIGGVRPAYLGKLVTVNIFNSITGVYARTAYMPLRMPVIASCNGKSPWSKRKPTTPNTVIG